MCVTIYYECSIQSLSITWNRPPSSQDFRQSLQQILNIMQEKHYSSWIWDVRKLGPISTQDKHWVNTNWFPDIMKLGLRQIAVVMSDHILLKYKVDDIVSGMDILAAHSVSGVNFSRQLLFIK